MSKLQLVHQLYEQIAGLECELKEIDIVVKGCDKHKCISVDDLYGDGIIIVKLNFANQLAVLVIPTVYTCRADTPNHQQIVVHAYLHTGYFLTIKVIL